jgi:flagellar hook assembly protein FlgD
MVKVRIKRAGRIVKRLGSLELDELERGNVIWDGRNAAGRRVRPGRYRVALKATDEAMNVTDNRALVVRVVRR